MSPNSTPQTPHRRPSPTDIRPPFALDANSAPPTSRPASQRPSKDDVIRRIRTDKLRTLNEYEFSIWVHYTYNPSMHLLMSRRHFHIPFADAGPIVNAALFDMWDRLQKRDTEMYVPAYFRKILSNKACDFLMDLAEKKKRRRGTPFAQKRSLQETPEETFPLQDNDDSGLEYVSSLNNRVSILVTTILEEIIAATKSLSPEKNRLTSFVFEERRRPTEICRIYGWSPANFTYHKNQALKELRPIIMERSARFEAPCRDLYAILKNELHEFKNPLHDFEDSPGSSLTGPIAAFVYELADTFHNARKR